MSLPGYRRIANHEKKGGMIIVAVVHPVDVAAREHMLSQGYGNPFIHHIT